MESTVRSKRDSTATDGTWTYEMEVLTALTKLEILVVKEDQDQLPYLIELKDVVGPEPYPNGIYTCCIEGSCIGIRVYHVDDLLALLHNS